MVLKRICVDSREIEGCYFKVSKFILFFVQNLKRVHHVIKISSNKVKLADGFDDVGKLSEDLKANFIIYGHLFQEGF